MPTQDSALAWLKVQVRNARPGRGFLATRIAWDNHGATE